MGGKRQMPSGHAPEAEPFPVVEEKKKSFKKRIETPKHVIDLIKSRLKTAERGLVIQNVQIMEKRGLEQIEAGGRLPTLSPHRKSTYVPELYSRWRTL